jgi:hypothetical protein
MGPPSKIPTDGGPTLVTVHKHGKAKGEVMSRATNQVCSSCGGPLEQGPVPEARTLTNVLVRCTNKDCPKERA